MERWFFLKMMSNEVLYRLIRDLAKRIEKTEEKIAPGSMISL